jgi:hypothetical protein
MDRSPNLLIAAYKFNIQVLQVCQSLIATVVLLCHSTLVSIAFLVQFQSLGLQVRQHLIGTGLLHRALCISDDASDAVIEDGLVGTRGPAPGEQSPHNHYRSVFLVQSLSVEYAIKNEQEVQCA